MQVSPLLHRRAQPELPVQHSPVLLQTRVRTVEGVEPGETGPEGRHISSFTVPKRVSRKDITAQGPRAGTTIELDEENTSAEAEGLHADGFWSSSF